MKEQLFASEIQYKNDDGSFIMFTIDVDEDNINISCNQFSELAVSSAQFIESTISDLTIRIMDTRMLLRSIKYDSDGFEHEDPISLSRKDFFDMVNGTTLMYSYDN